MVRRRYLMVGLSSGAVLAAASVALAAPAPKGGTSIYQGALSTAQKLAVIRRDAPRLAAKARIKLPAIHGLQRPVRLSARRLYGGRALMSVYGAASVDAASDKINLIAVNTNYRLPAYLNIRFMPDRPGQAVLVDATISSNTRGNATVTARRSDGSIDTLPLHGYGAVGHLRLVVVPTRRGWQTVTVKTTSGNVMIQNVEVTPTH